MIENEKYNKAFFTQMEEHAYRSARVVIPLVNELFKPGSVIDIGCGTGAWLKAWNEIGIDDFLGVEGPYVQNQRVLIPPDKIIYKDLKQSLDLGKKYDLAMSLEVAEHLPASNADSFIQSLISASNVVLFSAAIPGQEGTYHINEQYPEYWASIFQKVGYIPIDCIRPKIWKNTSVEFYYRQNILVFIKKENLKNYPSLYAEAMSTNPEYLSRIHPEFFDLKNEHIRRTKSYWGFVNWKWYEFKTKYLKRNGK